MKGVLFIMFHIKIMPVLRIRTWISDNVVKIAWLSSMINFLTRNIVLLKTHLTIFVKTYYA